MLKFTFFLLLALSAMFAIGFFAVMGVIVLLAKSSESTRTSVKAVDILAREGYDMPPRTRRRKDLARDLAYV